jgi:hypothetical protein
MVPEEVWSHDFGVPQRNGFETALTGIVAGTVGLVTWLATMASAPRYSYGASQDVGNGTLFPILLGAAVGGALVAPRRAALVGAMLGLPGLVLSPWTAPRGDNDGLWILIVPFMGVFTVVLVATALAAAGARSWHRQSRGPRPP